MLRCATPAGFRPFAAVCLLLTSKMRLCTPYLAMSVSKNLVQILQKRSMRSRGLDRSCESFALILLRQKIHSRLCMISPSTNLKTGGHSLEEGSILQSIKLSGWDSKGSSINKPYHYSNHAKYIDDILHKADLKEWLVGRE